MSAITLDSAFLDIFEASCQDKKFRQVSAIDGLRKEALETPRPFSGPRLRALNELLPATEDAEDLPQWIHQMARSRDAFQNTVICIETAPGVKKYLKFLYAVITPCSIGLSPLTRVTSTRVEGPPSWENLDDIRATRYCFPPELCSHGHSQRPSRAWH